jgi:hypothetical protein
MHPPLKVRNKTVYLQYSTRQDIGTGATVVQQAAPAAIGSGPVVVATMECSDVSEAGGMAGVDGWGRL